MKRKSALLKYFDYHFWATQRLVKLLDQLDDSVMQKEIASSFPSLRSTLAHMAFAEEIWLHRLKGSNTRSWNQWKDLSSQQVMNEYMRLCRTMVSHLKTSDLDDTITYKNSSGEAFQQTMGEIGMHVVNHASYHRGQIVSMLRAQNFKTIPAFDLIVYLRT